MTYIAYSGDLVSGHRFAGPFASEQEALDRTANLNDTWRAAPIRKIEGQDGEWISMLGNPEAGFKEFAGPFKSTEDLEQFWKREEKDRRDKGKWWWGQQLISPKQLAKQRGRKAA
jgi:hypothetical protein